MKPEDKIMLVLSIAVALFIILALFNPIVRGVSVSKENAKLLQEIVISIIPLIAMYVGLKLRRKSE